jgi:hypothetical protein
MSRHPPASVLQRAWQALREAAEAFSVPDRAAVVRTPHPPGAAPPTRRTP